MTTATSCLKIDFKPPFTVGALSFTTIVSKMKILLNIFRTSILILSILTPFFTATASTAKPEEDSPYMQKVDEADKACNEGKWKEAAEALTAALKLEPGNPSNILLMSNLGIIRFNMGQDSLALAILTDAHVMAPASVTILSNRARVLSALGMEEEAYKDYDLILQLDSTVISPRFHHCLLALRAHKFKTAKADFEFMERNFPSETETNIAGASVLSGTGEFAVAIPYYNKVLEEHKDAEFYSGRGYCHMLCGNLQNASDDINAALSMTPDDGELYLYRAALNKMRYRPDDAKADALKAIELGVDKKRAAQFLDKQSNSKSK